MNVAKKFIAMIDQAHHMRVLGEVGVLKNTTPVILFFVCSTQ